MKGKILSTAVAVFRDERVNELENELGRVTERSTHFSQSEVNFSL